MKTLVGFQGFMFPIIEVLTTCSLPCNSGKGGCVLGNYINNWRIAKKNLNTLTSMFQNTSHESGATILSLLLKDYHCSFRIYYLQMDGFSIISMFDLPSNLAIGYVDVLKSYV